MYNPKMTTNKNEIYNFRSCTTWPLQLCPPPPPFPFFSFFWSHRCVTPKPLHTKMISCNIWPLQLPPPPHPFFLKSLQYNPKIGIEGRWRNTAVNWPDSGVSRGTAPANHSEDRCQFWQRKNEWCIHDCFWSVRIWNSSPNMKYERVWTHLKVSGGRRK